jgi:hypothetical protein
MKEKCFMKNFMILIALVIGLIFPQRISTALTLSSREPGNIFVRGASVELQINEAQSGVEYVARDYFDNTISQGEAAIRDGKGTINLDKLPPGWYELNCKDDKGKAHITFGVVLNRGKKALAKDGKIGADIASAWLIKDERYRLMFAKMLRNCGIPWVRERLSWSYVEPQQGKFQWGVYQTVADTLAAEGISIVQVWHDAPEWTLASNRSADGKPNCPQDLRTVYRFAKAVAEHFAPQIQSWEVWNEPDIEFWNDTTDRFAGLQKAAYLGFKDGNPQAKVLQASICQPIRQLNKAEDLFAGQPDEGKFAVNFGSTLFVENLYDSGVGDYFDIFNWHHYTLTKPSFSQLKQFRELMNLHDISNKPVWITEAGIRLKVSAEKDYKGLLTPNDRKIQCRYIAQSMAQSLAAGNDRHFYFVVPNYLEDGYEFGVLRPNLNPMPGFLALSAAANILGQAEYLGAYPTENKAITAKAFKTPEGEVLVVWSDEQGEFTLPTELPKIQVMNIFGQETVVTAQKGMVQVRIGPEPVYLMNVGSEVFKHLLGQSTSRPATTTAVTTTAAATTLPTTAAAKITAPSRVVVSGHCELPFYKPMSCYLLNSETILLSNKTFDYEVEVYNFNEKKNAGGIVEIEVPAGWKSEPRAQAVEVTGMGRRVLTFKITAVMFKGIEKVWARGDFEQEKVAPAVSYFTIQANKPTTTTTTATTTATAK